jgi:N-sulfoglucosamine sulfohydrolase
MKSQLIQAWFLRITLTTGTAIMTLVAGRTPAGEPRPNILLAISDDQSFAHTSAAGFKAAQTPAFDRVAREGILIRNAFAASPGCSPCRASLLTGRHTWQIEQAGTHASSFPTNYVVFPDLLEQAGYWVGYTGKGWGPGDWKVSGRTRNPAGPMFSQRKNKPPFKGISNNDYAGNFSDFLAQRPQGKPFYFWYGATEPHRDYEKGSGLKSGKKLEQVVVPPFLPDTPEVRSDILDYCVEIEWFDTHLARMLKVLEDAGELDNTLVIVTSDNGMPFPRAKANCYEYGIHMPLAIRWGAKAPGGRVVDDIVGFVDLTATILEVGGARPPPTYPISGRSLLNILASTKQGLVDPTRAAAWSARERHSSSRYNNWTYPQRALRTPQFLYIRNFQPDRWPAGDPRILRDDGSLGPMHGAYCDIDGSPTLKFLVEKCENPAIGKYLQLAVAKRPAEELFDITRDPGCLKNLAVDPSFAKAKQELSRQLLNYLKKTGDPRVIGSGDIWESYPRYSPIRKFPPPDEMK